MTTYYGLYGQKVQYLASDPPAPQTGQVWYNSTSATLKVRSITTSGAWASATAMPTAKNVMGQAGTAIATVIFGGNTDPSYVNTTQTYNGSSWSTPPAVLNNARGAGGSAASGTQTSALYFGGTGPGFGPTTRTAITESYNGTSWSPVNSMNTSRESLGGAGTQTSALAFGGFTSGPYPTGNTAATESWNGTSWTSVNSLNQTRDSLGSCGTQTSALAAGGQIGPPVANSVELWNGTSWTAIPGVLNTARGGLGMFGIQTAAVAFGGSPSGVTAATELFNGTSWTNNPTGLGTARTGFINGAVGTQAGTGLAIGGSNPALVTNVELWTGPGVGTTKTVTVT